jgi:YVTN family beta-propeller protein
MTVVDSITVGGRPHGIAISPDGNTLYTTNYYTDDISVVDLTLPEPAEISRIKVDPDADPLIPEQYQPNEAIVSPDGSRLYVTMIKKAEVRVIDLVSETVIATVPTGGIGFLEDLNPSGTELYVADWGAPPDTTGPGRTVTVISTSSLGGPAAIISHPSISRPHGIAFSPDGRFAFVTNENATGAAPQHHPTQGGGRNGNIMVIDTATRAVVKVVELEPFSAGIAVLY